MLGTSACAGLPLATLPGASMQAAKGVVVAGSVKAPGSLASGAATFRVNSVEEAPPSDANGYAPTPHRRGSNGRDGTYSPSLTSEGTKEGSLSYSGM